MHLSVEQINGGIEPPHQGIRSSLIVPVRFREQVAGIIHLHSKEPGKYDETGKRIPMDLKVGDRVIYAKYGGTEIKVDDEELMILRESDILAKKSGK